MSALMPDRIQVGPFTYTVKLYGEDVYQEKEACGLCWIDKLEIGIYEGLPLQRQAETLLHEILHACWHVAGLPDRTREEQAITSLSVPMAQVFRDNPLFLTWFIESVRIR